MGRFRPLRDASSLCARRPRHGRANATKWDALRHRSPSSTTRRTLIPQVFLSLDAGKRTGKRLLRSQCIYGATATDSIGPTHRTGAFGTEEVFNSQPAICECIQDLDDLVGTLAGELE